jgi:hypothetical protein
VSPPVSPNDLVAEAQRWHDFYLLTGGAAATLSGLMFVAVTFGAGLVRHDELEGARAFIDPPLFHFVHVIITACLFVMPTMTAGVLGVVMLGGAGMRLLSLVWIYRQFRRAHRMHGDLDTSDWVMGIGLPAVAFVAIIVAAIGLVTGHGGAFTILAVATLAVLVIGLRSAWELMLWLITEVGRRNQ